MGSLAAGSVVLVPFPFSDLSETKLRPAVVLASGGRGDWIMCQITSNPFSDLRAITLNDEDFLTGGLRRASFARPGKLFTASGSLVVSPIGTLKPATLSGMLDAVIAILKPQFPISPFQ